MSLLIRSATPPELASQHWIKVQEPDVYLGDGYSASPVGATIIAQDGVVLDQEEYLAIRPLGNSDGQATGPLRYTHFMGEEQVLAGDPQATDPIEQLYPADNLPFEIEIRHYYFDTPATPASTGWGFRAEIIGGSASRDPSARSTGAATDDTYTTWRWPALGAFIEGPSAWQVDDQGQPLTVWYQNSWDGYRRPTKETWYVALLVGPTPEGKATLPVDVDGVVYQFWEHDQDWTPPPDATWVDTGAVVVLASAWMYTCSIPAVAQALTAGEVVRLGDKPAKFVKIWPGTEGLPAPWLQFDSTDTVNFPNPGILPAGTHLWRYL